MTTGRCHASVDGPIGWIVLDNPGRYNAMSVSMWRSLAEEADRLEQDTRVRVIVLRGAGERAFVSGADISEFGAERDTVEANERYEELGAAAIDRVAGSSKPTIAMLQGWCLGGGVAIALGCDLRIADDTLRFGIPAARLGIGYRWPGIKKLVDTVGPANAREIFLTARRFDAADGLRMGFVNRCVPAGRLEAAIREECEILAANAPLTMAAVKIAITELLREGDSLDIARMDAATRRAFASADFIEGKAAFIEKRPPRFQGA